MIAREMLDAVLRFHDDVRFVYIVSHEGKLITYRARQDTPGLAPLSAMIQVFAKTAIAATFTEPEESYHGKTLSFVVTKERLRLIVIPQADFIVLVSTEHSFPMAKVDELAHLVDSEIMATRGPRSSGSTSFRSWD